MIGVGSGVLSLEESMKDLDSAGVEADLPFQPNDPYYSNSRIIQKMSSTV